MSSSQTSGPKGRSPALPRYAARRVSTPCRRTPNGTVTAIGSVHDETVRINGGFFAMRQEMFDYIRDGEELVEQPFARLIEQQRLIAFRWDGFWQCMDTFKDKITFDRLEARGDCPWKVWLAPPSAAPR